MKNIFNFILISLIILTATVANSSEINTKLMNKTIVIDIGHGGKDSGTVEAGIKEKDINLSIANILKNELIKRGANVLVTRDNDYDLSKPNATRRKKSDFDNRIDYINKSNADLYLSIHINYLENKNVHGAQVFYTEKNKILANVIQDSFNSYLKSPLKEKEISDNIYMYKKINIPGVLIECGFLSNPKERNLLTNEEYQIKIAKSIIEALIIYF